MAGGKGFWRQVVAMLDDLTDVDVSTTPPLDGQALVYDDASSTWLPATVAGGGGGALTLIAEQTVGAGGASSIDFTAIPGTYRDLVVVGRVRSDRSTDTDALNVRLGAAAFDTGTNYTYSSLRTGSNTAATQSTSASFIQGGGLDMPAAGAGALANHWGMFRIELLDYADTSYWRQMMVDTHAQCTAAVHNRGVSYGQWKNAVDAVQRLRLFPNTGPNFVEGSVATLYGRG